jgi:DNA polymerase-3 subunit beta
MKLKVMQSNLLPALTTAARAINPRVTLPVLEGVLLVAEGDRLELHSTNLEIGFRIPVSAKIEEPGRVVIKGKSLLEIVKNAPKDGLIEISAGEGSGADVPVVVLAGRVSRKLKGIDAEEYPAIELPPQSKQLTVGALDLRAAIEQVVAFASSEDARPILQGVALSASPVGLRLTAANNFTMGTTPFPITDGDFGPGEELVIPHKSLTEVTKLLAKATAGETVLIQYGERNQVWFDFSSGIRLVSRLIDGQYPNWQQVMPVEGAHGSAARMVVDRDALAELLRAVNGASVARLTLKPDRIEVWAKQGYDDDEVDASIDATGDVDFMVWGFDPAQLRLVVNSAPGKQLVLYAPGPLSPALIYSPDDEARYAIMPVRLSNA